MVTDLYEIIDRRRDVRAEFTGEPIPAAALTRILRAAHCAPSVGMSQPWDFVVIRDHNTRAAFHEHVMHRRKDFQDVLPADRGRLFDTIKIEGILESSAGIVVTYDCMRAGPAVLGRHTNPETGLFSVCLAIENLWLAATAEGLGVGWVSFYDEEFLRELVGIPTPVRPIAWLCLGPVSGLQAVPDLQRHGWRARTPLSSVLHFEQYGGRH